MSSQLPIANGVSSPEKQHALDLIARKDSIQEQIDAHLSVLTSNNSTLHSPLVDPQGFPRADIDIVAVRHARVKIIELRNDLAKIMEEISEALQKVYNVESTAESSQSAASTADVRASDRSNAEEPAPPQQQEAKPFARVDGVAPSSPAADAGLIREDLIVRFGTLTHTSFTSLTSLAEMVAAHQNRSLPIIVKRGPNQVHLTLTPRSGWGGRGLLGCHIVPYSR